jgi:hypothetical protein
MEIKKKITIELEDQEAKDFKSLIDKMYAQMKSVGFKNKEITADEVELITKLQGAL